MSGSIPPRERDLSDEQIYTPSGQGAWSDRLERRLLHKMLVAINLPAEWPGWLVGVVALLPILGVAGFWWLLVGSEWALYLAVMLALFTLFDTLVLVSLPRRRLSFGPVGPQLYTLEFPRLLVAVLAALLALWLGPMLALLGVVIINLGASLALAWAPVAPSSAASASVASLVAVASGWLASPSSVSSSPHALRRSSATAATSNALAGRGHLIVGGFMARS